MAKLLYRCECCNKVIEKEIVFKADEDALEIVLGNLMLNNGYYPDIERFVIHNCYAKQKGVARLSGISLGE